MVVRQSVSFISARLDFSHSVKSVGEYHWQGSRLEKKKIIP